MRTRFGEFVFDTDRRLLERAGTPVHLTAKAFALLRVLVVERPRAVSKAELMDRIWPDVIVAAENVKNLVSELRSALDDHSLIRTVYGFGYAFSGVTTDDQIDPGYWLLHGAEALPLRAGVTEIGRDPTCGICIDAPGVSRRHARITLSNSSATLEDLGSKNGTLVDRVRIAEPVSLRDGDRIRLGSVTLVFRTRAGEESATDSFETG